MRLDTKIVEVLKESLNVVIFWITLSRLKNPIDWLSNVLTVAGIVISLLLMFYGI